MRDRSFTSRVELPVSAAEAFAWHARPGAFGRLTPPWRRLEPEGEEPAIEDGSRRRFRMRLGPFRRTWVAEHRAVRTGESFTDVQVEGPFAAWTHEHRFEALGAERCRLVDAITYRLPAGPLGALLAGRIEGELARDFAWRRDVLRRDLALLAGDHGRPRLAVALSGATGFVGAALADLLTTQGHEVLRIVRDPKAARAGEIAWDTAAGTVDARALAAADAVVHLAGESVAGGRWTEKRKRRIRASRIEGTRAVVAAMGAAQDGPKTLVCASAVGYYGDRGDALVDETTPPGEGFLPDVARAWEDEALAAEKSGARVALTRFSLVLGAGGGALATMLPAFRAGLGARLGDGAHWMPWVTREDVIFALHHALRDDRVRGPINVTAPAPVTNAAFTATLARVLSRPAFLVAPRPALRLALGREMAEEMVFASCRAVPTRARELGVRFVDDELEPALRRVLGRMREDDEIPPTERTEP